MESNMDVEVGPEPHGLKKCQQSLTLEFTDLSYAVSGRKGQFQKSVLRSLNGQFKAGRLTAIIGPSGAGKSTLLNIVSGFKLLCMNRTRGVQGSLRVNGQPRDLRLFRRQCCYIAQEFAMLPRLTTVETLTVAAELKLGRNTCCSIKETVALHNARDFTPESAKRSAEVGIPIITTWGGALSELVPRLLSTLGS
uniref:ABC transporter domain-containing protein n=1 Tax=Timema cristinae TaxID=61476 RepID=A0A7R9H2W5_TIMCR|nr:unnamed protein product [Timema cristinae]